MAQTGWSQGLVLPAARWAFWETDTATERPSPP